MEGELIKGSAFNYRPLLPLAIGLGGGVIIAMHIEGAAAAVAALPLLMLAYAAYKLNKRMFALFLFGAALGFVRMLPLTLGSKQALDILLQNAKYSNTGRSELAGLIVDKLASRCDELFIEASPIARAILFNDRSELEYFQGELFRTVGVSHTLALSGLHVSALSAAIMYVIPASRAKLRAVSVSLFLCLYCALAGFPASLVRAAIMFACILFAPLFLRKADTLSSLSLAFLLIVLIAPLSVYSAGFCLSFSAVLGIAMLYAPIMKRLPSVMAPAAVTVAATLGTLPFTLSFFGTLPLYSVFANIFIVPLITLGLVLSFCSVVLSYIVFPLGKLIAIPARLLLDASEAVSALFAKLPCSLIELNGFGGAGCALYFASIVFLSRYCLMPRRKKLIMASVFLLLAGLTLIVP